MNMGFLPDRAPNPVRQTALAAGFTLLEVLVGIAVLVIIVAAILYAHSELIRAQELLRNTEEKRIVTGRIAAETWLGAGPENIVTCSWEGWKVEYVADKDTGGLRWVEWTCTPSNRPSGRSSINIRMPPSSAASTSSPASAIR